MILFNDYVVNMNKERIKEIFGEYWDGIKDKSWWNLSNKEFENIAYKQVAEELKQGDYKPHIQLKAVEKAKGNKEVIESLYIQFRVSELTNQFIVIARDHEAKVNIERLKWENELKAKKKEEKQLLQKVKAIENRERALNDPSYKRQTSYLGAIVIFCAIIILIIFIVAILENS
jgi:hypothetical protein